MSNNKNFVQAINEAYSTIYPENESKQFHVTVGELDSGSRIYMDNSEMEYSRIGINKIEGQVIVFDTEGIGEEPIHGVGQEPTDVAAWMVNFNSIEEVEQSGLKAGWLVMHGPEGNEEPHWNIKGQDQFEQWLKQNQTPGVVVDVDHHEEESEYFG